MTTAVKRAAAKGGSHKKAQKEQAGADLSASYNEFKEFEGRRYTGMKIGRSHGRRPNR